MSYTKDTKLSDIKNALKIAISTKTEIDNLINTTTLDYFVKVDDNGEYSIKTESLSTICGTSSGAIANQIKKRKGSIYEKLGDFFATWTKGGAKLNAAEIAAQSAKNAKIETAISMFKGGLKLEQIATFTGLSVDELKEIDELKTAPKTK